MTQNEIAQKILKILIEYDNASKTVKQLEQPSPNSSHLGILATSSLFQLPISNEMEGIEFSILQERLNMSSEFLEDLIIKLLKYGAITCFNKITSSDFSLVNNSSHIFFPPNLFSSLPPNNNILLAITSEGRKIYNNNQKLNALFPHKITMETEEKIKTTKPKRLTFKKSESAFYLGNDKCNIPLYTSRTANLSYEFLMCEFLYTKDNNSKMSFGWDEIYDYMEKETQDDNITDKYRKNKIKKCIKDTIIRINNKTKSIFKLKILQFRRGVIVKLK